MDKLDEAGLAGAVTGLTIGRSLALVHDSRENYVRCTAETAECTCPEFCERDHDRD